MTERRVRGRCAVPGFAAGPAIVLSHAIGKRTASGDPEAEAAALRAAIDAAARAIDRLAQTHQGEAAEILEVQAEFLRDDELSRPAFADVAGGLPADQAWQRALDAEITGYEASEDEYFRARAADLRDLRARVLRQLCGTFGEAEIPAGAIVFADDLLPSAFLDVDWSAGGGIVLSAGSPNSHVALLARSRRIPMVVATGVDPADFAGEALVNGAAGFAILQATAETRAAFDAERRAWVADDAAAARRASEPATTRDGVRIKVCLNVGDPIELETVSPEVCDGIGLVRTEFLFSGGRLPDENKQYAAYVRLVAWAAGRPVTIRTLDAGGDKPIAGLTVEGESNPFLGIRGIRLSLARPEVFRVQLRALARAACHGALAVMLPMVTTASELAGVRALLDEEIRNLDAAGIPARRPPLGIMVEVPAAALAIETFDADFYSIGSNDLVQYLTAAARDTGGVAHLADPLHPAVLKLIRQVVVDGTAASREVSLCGESGGDPALIPHLLAAGLRALSVSPASVARTKAAIRRIDLTLPPTGGGDRA